MTLIEHAAREKVQRESDAAVQKAVSELAFVGQEVVRLQDALRGRSNKRPKPRRKPHRSLGRRSRKYLAPWCRRHCPLYRMPRRRLSKPRTACASKHSKRKDNSRNCSSACANRCEPRWNKRDTNLGRLRQEAAKLPADLEAACRVSIARMEEELDQKSSEMQHSAYEALLKTSEWYQKKAQTAMQSTMERVIEQSSTA